MLLVFGTHGAPGASTLSIYTAAMWTAGGRSIGLLDGDPTGGTLASHLRLLQDPGVASLVTKRNIDVDTVLACTQNVLVEKMRVSPLPASLQGASLAAQKLADRGEELHRIAKGLPIIVDAGRAYFGTPAAQLVPHATAVILVVQSAHLPAMAELANYRQMLGLEAESRADSKAGPKGGPRADSDAESDADAAVEPESSMADSIGLVTVGDQYFTDEEFKSHTGLPVVANFPYDPTRAYNFVDTLHGINRAAKKFLEEAKTAADILWELTYPDMSPEEEKSDKFGPSSFEEAYADDPFAHSLMETGSEPTPGTVDASVGGSVAPRPPAGAPTAPPAAAPPAPPAGSVAAQLSQA